MREMTVYNTQSILSLVRNAVVRYNRGGPDLLRSDRPVILRRVVPHLYYSLAESGAHC